MIVPIRSYKMSPLDWRSGIAARTDVGHGRDQGGGGAAFLLRRCRCARPGHWESDRHQTVRGQRGRVHERACPCAPVSSKAQQDARTQIHTRSLARAHTHTYTHSLASLVPSTGRYSAVEAVAFIWKLGFCGVPWKAWERESILGRVLSLPIISASVPRRS